MFTKTNTTKPKTWKKTVIAALAGIACVAVGTQLLETQQQEEMNTNLIGRYTQSLVDHADYARNHVQVMDSLITEGVENMHATYAAAEGVADAYVHLAGRQPAKALKEKAKPAMAEGTKRLEGNVKWGNKSEKSSVDPAKIQKTFADTAQFQADIAQMFPKSYANISKLRQDLKIHYFDLQNTIKDVELIAQTTKDGLRKSVRKLDLRKRYVDADKLSANTDEKIWKYQVKYQLSQLNDSMDKCKEVVAVLVKLQKDCARTQDNIENELQAMEVELKRDIARKQVRITELEQQLKAMKCKWWQALLTLGMACVKINKAKAQMRRVMNDFKAQIAVSKKLQDRMFYFEGLSKTAAVLVHEASGMLETTKKLENRLGDTIRELEQDFTDEEIDDNLWDEDFANDFAERLYESLDRLNKMCDETILDCKNRKARLLKALIWGDL